MLHKNTEPLLKEEASFRTILFVENRTTDTNFFILAVPPRATYSFIVANKQQASEILYDIVPDLILLDNHLSQVEKSTFTDMLRSIRGQQEVPVKFFDKNTCSEHMAKCVDETSDVLDIEEPLEVDHFLGIIKYALA